MVKTDAPDPVQVGQPLTYTLAVQNLGATTATGVVATDTLPASVTFVSATSTQGTCTQAGITVTCAVGTLPGLAQATITIVVIPTTAGTISNTATVTQTEVDTNPANNTDTEPTTVITSADLGITIADSPDPVEAGQNITYAVQVTNNGPSTASGASMTFAIPANTNFRAITPPAGWTCSTPAVGGTGTITCTNPSVPNGAVADFGIVVQVNAATAAGTIITATANIASTTTDANPSNNSASTTTAVVAANVVTRATLRGLRVDPSGQVEFATGSQRQTAAFNLYTVADARGRGERTLITEAPIPVRVPDSITPLLYSVRTAPLRDPYLVIEEIDERGRRRFMGPFDLADEGLRDAFERLESRLTDAGAVEIGTRRRLGAGDAGAARRAPGPAARTRAKPAPRAGRPLAGERSGAIKVEIADRRPGHAHARRDGGVRPAAGVPARPARRLHPGQKHAFTVEADAIAFQASALSTAYTGRNVFIVAWQQSVPGHGGAADPLRPAGRRRATRGRRRTTSTWPTRRWTRTRGSGTCSSRTRASGPTSTTGSGDLRPAGPSRRRPVVPVRLHVHGRTDHRHAVEARINGVLVGTADFTGLSSALIEGAISADALRAGANSLTLTYTASGGNPAGVGLLYLADLEMGLPVDPPSPATVELGSYDPSLPPPPRHGLPDRHPRAVPRAGGAAGGRSRGRRGCGPWWWTSRAPTTSSAAASWKRRRCGS